MPNEEDLKKIKDFVDHLLGLPNISSEPILIGEGLILNFIVQNSNQLKITFKTPQFFPHLEWNEVLQILFSELYGRMSSEVLPFFYNIIDSSDLNLLNQMSSGPSYPVEFQQEKLKGFIDTIFRNKDVRYNFNSVFNIIKFQILDKYITEIFNRRDSIYNEIVRVRKLNFEFEEYLLFIKILLIVRGSAYIKIPFSPGGGNSKVSLIDSLKMPGKPNKFINAMTAHLMSELQVVPDILIQLALKSNIKESLTEMNDALPRFVYILCSRYHNYKPVVNVDRGAESPDKSWFAIARKNAEYHGFDKRLVDGLYRIAGDNNW